MNYFPIFQTATQLAYDDWCYKINLLSLTCLDFHQILMSACNYRLTTTICTGNDPNLVYACIDDICHLRQLLFLIDNKLIL
jgi:hypothetical protein